MRFRSYILTAGGRIAAFALVFAVIAPVLAHVTVPLETGEAARDGFDVRPLLAPIRRSRRRPRPSPPLIRPAPRQEIHHPPAQVELPELPPMREMPGLEEPPVATGEASAEEDTALEVVCRFGAGDPKRNDLCAGFRLRAQWAAAP